MDNPKISVLVPVYGVEKYIERCARSIFGQTYQNLEIIFVDDCTSDRSIEILQQVLNDYPARKPQTRILRHDHNRGLSAARNTAMRAASGDYIYFVDSDDKLYDEESIRNLVNVAKARNFPDLIVGNTEQSGFPGHQQNLSALNPEILKTYSDDKAWIKMSILNPAALKVMAWNKLIKLSLLRNNKMHFIEGCLNEDQYWTFQLSKIVSSVAVCFDYTYLYYYNKAGIMFGGGNLEKRKKSFDTFLNLMIRNVDGFCKQAQVAVIDNLYRSYITNFRARVARFERFLLLNSKHPLANQYLYFCIYQEATGGHSPIFRFVKMLRNVKHRL